MAQSRLTLANFERTPFADAAPSYPPVAWRAAWIWTSDATEGVHDYVCFRREFTLFDRPGRALLRLAAERDAALWVNDHLIAYGPPISDPRFKRYETHDIAGRLNTGINCVAVRVYHDNTRIGVFTAQAKARGLLCQLEIDGEVVIATDANWRARRSRAYIKPVAVMGDSMWPEIFNANEDTPGWTAPGFDDKAWPHAVPVIASVHKLWGSAQPQARFFPWVNLIPCETRPLRRDRLLPVAVCTQGEVLQRRQASPNDTAVRMSLEPVLPLGKATIIDAESLLSDGGSVRITNSALDESYESFDGIRNATLVLDFGRLINARLGLRLTTTGVSIDIGYAYHLEDGRVVPYVSGRTAIADHYIARSGEQSWESADWRHFRYVQLTFRNMSDALIFQSVWRKPRGIISNPAAVSLATIRRSGGYLKSSAAPPI